MNTQIEKQFVAQEHKTTNGIHWDLMLEWTETLRTWRITTHPADIQNASIVAERIFDHPLKFLTYEGLVQNGTGSVRIIDGGCLVFRSTAKDVLSFELRGDLLRGFYTLRKEKDSFWILQRQS